MQSATHSPTLLHWERVCVCVRVCLIGVANTNISVPSSTACFRAEAPAELADSQLGNQSGLEREGHMI